MTTRDGPRFPGGGESGLGREVRCFSAPTTYTHWSSLAALGEQSVDELIGVKGDEVEIYSAQTTPEVAAIAADEREHAEIWKALSGARAAGSAGAEGSAVSTAARAAVASASGDHAAIALDVSDPGQIADRERWHRASHSGTLRAEAQKSSSKSIPMELAPDFRSPFTDSYHLALASC